MWLPELLDEDVLVCADRKADKARVARLIELIPGLRPVNAGALEISQRMLHQTPPNAAPAVPGVDKHHAYPG